MGICIDCIGSTGEGFMGICIDCICSTGEVCMGICIDCVSSNGEGLWESVLTVLLALGRVCGNLY
jgi:hypothetical protein